MRASFFRESHAANGRSCAGFLTGASLQLIGFYWGVLGVIGIIASAVVRLSPYILALQDHALGALHWSVLVVFTLYMAHAEGYKGFHLNFSPRIVARALTLRNLHPHEALPASLSGFRRLLLVLLAPLFCMGFFHATRRRMLISWLVTSGIVVLVLLVSHAPQPWRGIIDTGVITGLALGIASLLWHWLRFEMTGMAPAIAADLPD